MMKLFEKTYKGKRILVTGHTGFKGSWLSMWLHQLGADVYGFSDKIISAPSHFEELGSENVDHMFGDICDQEVIEKRISEINPDFIFHLAAQAIVSESIEDPLSTIKTNALGTAHILEAVKKNNKPCSVVFVTSDKCYENVETYYGYRETDLLGGKDPYSASKAAAECIIHAYWNTFFMQSEQKINIASARAGNVIGGGDWAKDRLIPDLILAWKNKREMVCRRPESTRPWQHVLEPLSGYLLLGCSLANDENLGEAFNFGPPGEDVNSVRQVIESLIQYLPELNVSYVENKSINDSGLLKLNCDKAVAKLNWRPVLNYEETIKMTAEWYAKFYKENSNTSNITSNQINTYCTLAGERGLTWAL